jgi:23S rRNA (uracil1939-C5)-methyltransferase
MALIEESISEITHLNEKGLGVAKTPSGEALIPKTLPGDVVKFQKHSYRGKTNSLLIEIIKPSPSRTKADCSYFESCGGCMLQNMRKIDYENFKLTQVENFIKKSGLQTKLDKLITAPPGKRRRANMEFSIKTDRFLMGFHRFSTHHIIDIETCIALDKNLSDLINPIKEFIKAIAKEKNQGQIFLTQADNGVDLVIDFHEKNFTDNFEEVAINFQDQYKLLNLLITCRNKTVLNLCKSKPYVLFSDVEVEINARCFLQATKASDEILGNLVIEFFQEAGAKKPIDLFCGRGTYTILLSKLAPTFAVESDVSALFALNDAAKKYRLEIISAQRDLFIAPVTSKELSTYDFAVINPPRAGAFLQIKELAASNINSVCYISCNPETFFRDAEILIASGYNLLKIIPFDQFYWNAHIELVGYFVKSKFI